MRALVYLALLIVLLFAAVLNIMYGMQFDGGLAMAWVIAGVIACLAGTSTPHAAHCVPVDQHVEPLLWVRGIGDCGCVGIGVNGGRDERPCVYPPVPSPLHLIAAMPDIVPCCRVVQTCCCWNPPSSW